MKYLLLALFAMAVFGICFLADKGFNLLRKRAEASPVVRLPLRYPVMALVLAVVAVPVGIYGFFVKNVIYVCVGLCFLAMAVWAAAHYCRTGIIYDDRAFQFRSGSVQRTFRFRDIDGQRVAIYKRSCCLVLCLGHDEVVLYSNMQGFEPFLAQAYRCWCREKGLDPEGQDWHDPADHRWFPDQLCPEDKDEVTNY